jgi:predicted ATPase/class 3 adenylate cyclase/Tfp pilus assembly protein PilF
MSANFPSGNVTFLFTDIEGSTRLWERFPEAMKMALKRHDELLRVAIEAHTGYVFKTVGDAFCAAFANAQDALGAAISIQRSLHEADWPEEMGELRVRVCMHSGISEERDGDYFGPPLNRAARLLSAGHGGQALLTLTTRSLIGDQLPKGVSLRDMGERRLKDLLRPERVFQVIAPGLPSEFPALKTLDAHFNNLPAQPTSFVGREHETAAILALMRNPQVRLLTLTGPGGTGKTRLSLQVAVDVLDEYEHGVWFVELAPITDPALVLRSIATILGIKEGRGKSLEKLVSEHVRTRQMLLVIDNLEQVVEAASIFSNLLAVASRLKILATSREVLHLRGEHNYPVPPLSLPDIKRGQSLGALSQNEAVALFVQRGRAANPDLKFTEDSAMVIAEICVRLDGLPLAIELAAARSRILTPEMILQKLTHRLEVLTGGARDLPRRQQTIRSTIDWSYNLLSDHEKLLFAWVGVFSGGWTTEAVEALCDRVTQAQAMPLSGCEALIELESLVDKSLVRCSEGRTGETRFTMLETIREYALERLAMGGMSEMLRQQHAEYYVAWMENVFTHLSGHGQVEWLQRLEEEHDNLRAALGWIVKADTNHPADVNPPNAQVGLAARIGAVIWRFWFLHSHLSEGRKWMNELIRVIDPADVNHPAVDIPVSLRIKTLTGAGKLADEQGDPVYAIHCHERALALARQIGDDGEITSVTNSLGMVFNAQGEYEKAKSYFEESLSMARRLQDKPGTASALNNLGMIAIEMGQYPEAQKYHEESLAIKRELGDVLGVASSLNNLGVVARQFGDYAQAKRLYQDGLEMCRQVGHRMGTAIFLNNLGFLAITEKDAETATRFCAESLAIRKELGNKLGMASSLNNLGSASLMQDDAGQALKYWQESLGLLKEVGTKQVVEEILRGLARFALYTKQWVLAARLLGEAEKLREIIGTPLSTEVEAEQSACMAELHASLDEPTIHQARADGHALSVEQIMEDALAVRYR